MCRTFRSGFRTVARLLQFGLLVAAVSGGHAAGIWTPLTNLAPSLGNGVQLMVQMTDGTILVQSYDGQSWMKLTPDSTGSYINGTWSWLASSPVARLYFASRVLPDGRFVEVGGEYSGPGLLPNWSNTGEIYDPIANTWTPITPYPSQSGCGTLNYASGTLSAGSPIVTHIYPYTTGFAPGWHVSGPGIPNGTTIQSVDSSSQITLSKNATATLTGSELDFNQSYTLLACLGDDPSALLSGGNMLVGDLVNGNTFIYHPSTNMWTMSGTKVHSSDSSDEEGWAQMTDGSLMAYDLFQSVAVGQGFAEKYNPTTGLWSSISPPDGAAAGTLPVLSSPALGYELGPVLRLQDGRMIVVGANQHTALLNPSTTPLPTWSAGPDIIGSLNGFSSPFGADDAPAAVLPNGHVIMAADAGPSPVVSTGKLMSGSPVITSIQSTAKFQLYWSVSGTGIPPGAYITSIDSLTQVHISANATNSRTTTITWGGIFSNPTQLFDFDPTTNSVSPMSPAIPDVNLLYEGAYPTRMLILPTGQLLFSDASAQLWIYTSDGAPNPALRPVINKIAYNGGGVFTLTGQQLNGQSAGAAYGDDDQMDSNYPIIRMVTPTGKVYYARSYNWSAVSVAGGSTPETVNFTLNPGLTPGNYLVYVSGAGISSFPIVLNVTSAELNKQ
jgi:hypothetical protein